MKISIDSVNSLAIQAEYKQAHCRYADYLGSFQHPEHRASQDWTICLYSVCDALVIETNGDPVWQHGDHEGFASLIESYGIDLPAILDSENNGMLHDYKSGAAVRTATPKELADSIDAARRDGGAGVIDCDGRSCYVSAR
jgi:hypothetical protein